MNGLTSTEMVELMRFIGRSETCRPNMRLAVLATLDGKYRVRCVTGEELRTIKARSSGCWVFAASTVDSRIQLDLNWSLSPLKYKFALDVLQLILHQIHQ